MARNLAQRLARAIGHGPASAPLQLDDKVMLKTEDGDLDSMDPFFETSPTVKEWLRDNRPTGSNLLAYLASLFLFVSWIGSYNLTWLLGDAVAGFTVGIVFVPQGMAYAALANLPAQFGLYSSLMSAVIYWLFGTSKDISIAPVAILSTVVGSVVNKLGHEDSPFSGAAVAVALSLLSGAVFLAIGLLRLGWVIDLIPATALSAYMTGSSIAIAASQLPSLFGITKLSSRQAPYNDIIHILRNLGHTKMDAAMGLTCLFILYVVRYSLTKLSDRLPERRALFSFLNTMRTVVIILLSTLISYLINRSRKEDPSFKLIGVVPKGFQNAGLPQPSLELLGKIGPNLPSVVMVMLAEHIAVAKSFGRAGNYNINTSQELISTGVANMAGAFLGSYPSTGSFSRTAIQCKAGVRTPAAGLFTGLVVILAIYLLTGVFFWIPKAALAAVIIHAVGDLVTPPSTLRYYWAVSPVELLVFLVGVFMGVFYHIEDALYTTIALSAVLLMYRLLKSGGRFMGEVDSQQVQAFHSRQDHQYTLVPKRDAQKTRGLFLPLQHQDGSNPSVQIRDPYPGIFIYRPSEGFNYANVSSCMEKLVNYVVRRTRPEQPSTLRKADLPWNQATRASSRDTDSEHLPTLKAIILDFGPVNCIDVTTVECLGDARRQLNVHAATTAVDWHFANINSRWTKRALITGGFGCASAAAGEGGTTFILDAAVDHGWSGALPSAHDMPKKSMTATERAVPELPSLERLEEGLEGLSTPSEKGGRERLALIHGVDRPLFHHDVASAVRSAVGSAEQKRGHE